jgi:hypothetical protein
VCASLGDACYIDIFGCAAIADCASTCTDDLCVDDCINFAALWGQTAFIDYSNCLACSCANDCQVTGCP